MEITSLPQYIAFIETLQTRCTHTAPPKFIYRGHGIASYQLAPEVFRYINTTQKSFIHPYWVTEEQILSDFISDACRYLRDIPEDDIATWLEISQHFGLPTRLLDFTENPLVALYFACATAPDQTGTVWILNEGTYKEKVYSLTPAVQGLTDRDIIMRIIAEKHADHPTIQYPWIYRPNYREERMHTQSSIFMIWGSCEKPLESFLSQENYIAEDDDSTQHTKIACRIQLPAAHKSTLLKQLDLCGINEKFIYPGLDGIGKYYNAKYSTKLE
jgi:hypothetical protein